ncbi:VanZ family protein [Cytobacillus kochii]|uniref:VanZ family protein n=1 Tax=Cytobacillus kochii TaxID=859143 RepID=UPI0025A012E0|nr:VanZ family protein [Cytobacillus kochii]MDM5209065.1 VanZ family protein [Cytobacillus kochii]
MLIDFDLLSYLIGFGFLGAILAALRVRLNKSKMYLFFFSIFFFYIINVVKFTLFPIIVGTSFAEEMKETTTIASNINLIPFNYQYIEQTLLNILLTVPFGFGLPYIKRKMNFKTIVGCGLLFTLLIETAQLIISFIIGYAYRIIDINDVLANLFGVIIGYIAFLLFSKMILWIIEKYIPKNEKLSPFLLYINKVSKNESFKFKDTV